MAYQALYRKHRPQTFDGVIGQAHITTILKHQVAEGRTAHAYLFTGTRGTGKTSTARILARAINCLSTVEGEPCGVCEACQISAGENPDIIEMDAASNSGVDDVRAMLEKVRFTPLQLKTKVYIIDEVHALSRNAFNALLKTLEEPPTHILFILATTEPQQLPATIISRCQRFDFHRIRAADMINLMREIITQSGAHIDEEGLLTIARAADGGMRDALSLADQCIAFCGENVTARDVYDMLGSMESGFLFDMADALIGADAERVLTLFSRVVNDGRDLTVFCLDLARHMRALMVAKLCGHASDILDCTEDDMRRYSAQAERMGEARLLGAVEQLGKLPSSLRWSSLPRVVIESALVRIARPEGKESLDALSARIEALEVKLEKLSQRGVTIAQQAPPPVVATPQVRQADMGQDGAPPWEIDLPPWESAPPEQEATSFVQDEPVSTPNSMPKAKPSASLKKEQASENQASSATIQTPSAVWEQVLSGLKSRDMMLYAMAYNGKATDISDGVLSVAMQKEIYVSALSKKENLALIEEFTDGLKVRFSTGEGDTQDVEARVKRLFGDNVKILD